MKRTVVVVAIARALAVSTLTLFGMHRAASTTAAPAVAASTQATPMPAAATDAPPATQARSGFYDGEAGLGPAERAGREIWYKATAGNARFHTYVFQQRIGILVDWFRVLRADRHGDRFRAWGVINDPACCIPGSDGCPAKRLEEPFGIKWSPGDHRLLAPVGRNGSSRSGNARVRDRGVTYGE